MQYDIKTINAIGLLYDQQTNLFLETIINDEIMAQNINQYLRSLPMKNKDKDFLKAMPANILLLSQEEIQQYLIILEKAGTLLQNKKFVMIYMNSKTSTDIQKECVNSLIKKIAEQNIEVLLCKDFIIGNHLQINYVSSWIHQMILQINENPLIFYLDKNIKKLISISDIDTVDTIYSSFNKDITKKNQYAYLYHISDLHLGSKQNNEKKDHLMNIFNQKIIDCHSMVKPYFFITGDLMNSPNNENLELASNFLFDLKYIYHGQVFFVLGNHDCQRHGLSIGRSVKSRVLSFLLDEKVKIIEELKMIVIRLDSNVAGQLARGKVGKKQLYQIDQVLSHIENIDDYTMITLLHHHMIPVVKPNYLKKHWFEKMIEPTKLLIDRALLIDWLKERNIEYVFHGHKHIPAMQYLENIKVFGCGSSTGSLKYKDGYKQHISYNIMKYDIESQKIVSCIMYHDDVKDNYTRQIDLFCY